ncbi:MAG: imidazole glycerol phosphate synthase subunit HisH [Syntrophus sp. (in: bacteria)]|nr:imidazole glycerol phosphate synthase subunit HisH [Syntrophus sp. (in: bacteria)]
MGNLFSIQSAIRYLGAESIITSDRNIISTADRIILPGVGSFYRAMEHLHTTDLVKVLRESVIYGKIPILGICLGMQLMGLSSTEDGFREGLGLVDCLIERFDVQKSEGLKIPHVGFDTVTMTHKSRLFDGLDAQVDFYFTHSYRMKYTEQPYGVGICFHGEPFIAAFEKEHICGTQFHPEKSQTNGLLLLKNFIKNF